MVVIMVGEDKVVRLFGSGRIKVNGWHVILQVLFKLGCSLESFHNLKSLDIRRLSQHFLHEEQLI